MRVTLKRQPYIGMLMILGALFGVPASAVELTFHHDVLLRVLRERVFTTQGRAYLQGGASDCTYAYLENPGVKGRDGRLQITAHLSTSLGLNVGGECVGGGDSTDVSMTGLPVYRNGVLQLDDVKVESAAAEYTELLQAFFGQNLGSLLRYPLSQEIERMLGDVSREGGYKIQIQGLTVSRILVNPSTVTVSIDFGAAVQ